MVKSTKEQQQFKKDFLKHYQFNGAEEKAYWTLVIDEAIEHNHLSLEGFYLKLHRELTITWEGYSDLTRYLLLKSISDNLQTDLKSPTSLYKDVIFALSRHNDFELRNGCKTTSQITQYKDKINPTTAPPIKNKIINDILNLQRKIGLPLMEGEDTSFMGMATQKHWRTTLEKGALSIADLWHYYGMLASYNSQGKQFIHTGEFRLPWENQFNLHKYKGVASVVKPGTLQGMEWVMKQSNKTIYGFGEDRGVCPNEIYIFRNAIYRCYLLGLKQTELVSLVIYLFENFKHNPGWVRNWGINLEADYTEMWDETWRPSIRFAKDLLLPQKAVYTGANEVSKAFKPIVDDYADYKKNRKDYICFDDYIRLKHFPKLKNPFVAYIKQ